MSLKITKIGATSVPQENQEVSIPIQARDLFIDLPGGGFDSDGHAMVQVSPMISLRFVIVETATPSLDATLDALLKELGKGRRIIRGMMRDKTTLRQTWVKLSGSVQRERRPGYMGKQPIVLNLRQNYPFWIASADEPVYLDDGEDLDDGWNLDAGHAESQNLTTVTTNFTITNSGTAPVKRGQITIKPSAAASITNPRITNRTNDRWLQYNGTLVAGQTLTIDLLTQTVLLDGIDAYDSMSVAEKTDWIILETDANAIRVTATAISGTNVLKWQWSKHYY